MLTMLCFLKSRLKTSCLCVLWIFICKYKIRIINWTLWHRSSRKNSISRINQSYVSKNFFIFLAYNFAINFPQFQLYFFLLDDSVYRKFSLKILRSAHNAPIFDLFQSRIMKGTLINRREIVDIASGKVHEGHRYSITSIFPNFRFGILNVLR